MLEASKKPNIIISMKYHGVLKENNDGVAAYVRVA